MTIYKQPRSHHWLIEVQVGGRRFRRSAKTTSKRQAQALERAWRTELEAPAPVVQPPPLTLSEALDRYFHTVIEPRNPRRSAQTDRYILHRIRDELGPQTPPAAITAGQIATFSEKLLREGKAPATINKYLAMLRAMLRKAARGWGVLHQVPLISLFGLRNERY